MIGPGRDSLPLSGVVGTPGATGAGRLPMAPALAPYDDADAAVAGGSSPWVRSLDGRWRFRLRDHPDGVAPADVDPATRTDGWHEVAVPSSWVLPADGSHERGAPIYLNVRMPFDGQAPFVPKDNPTGVYRREFTVPAPWRARRTLLRVGAANSMGFVWVNGTFVGFGTDSHLASTYDITGDLQRGTNTVCIAVPRWSASTWVEDQDQWWMPGLHRSVELVSVPPIALGDTATVPGLEPDGTTGTLDVDIGVDVAATMPGPVTVEVSVTDPSRRGRTLATTGPLDVPRWTPRAGGDEHAVAYTWPGHRVLTRLQVPAIEPWNHEMPRRYRAVIVLRDCDGTVLDARARWVGFRRIERGDRTLLVNGVPVVINGVNHHDVHPDRGPAPTTDDTRRDLELMKRHHVNAVRTSHYPKDESFYDLCDELGLYVVDEADIETHGRWRATSDDPVYAAAFVERGMRMVLRDRSHPCVIAWSLGNESGYGPSHDAMAAWIRRVDPSRPLHYEGGFSLDLDAAAPVSDIVCPMYASVERITRWSDEGRDRRPLILCEYNHAMGQAGGLADYWAVFGSLEGLQGGFVWEWCDHGLRKSGPDGHPFIAYGGDFGEREHDGNFVCDGLVSADREPHPLLAELAALTQPVTVERLDSGDLRITNRRWFADLSDLRARWELTIEGERAAAGRLEIPSIGPGESAVVPPPTPPPRRPGRATLTARFAVTERGRPAWADDRWEAAVCTVDVPDDVACVASGNTRRHRPTAGPGVDVDPAGAGVVVGEFGIGWPTLSLWRAPTDNDDPPGAWRATTPAARWRADGLDAVVVSDEQVRRRGPVTTRVVRLRTGTGRPITHRQRIERTSPAELSISETITIDRSLRDIPRVGVEFALPPEFDELSWLGPGPGDSYPDRRAAAHFGRWRAAVSDLVVPFVKPQEYGLHVDTRWFQLASASAAIRVDGDRPLAFSALPLSTPELTATDHVHELPSPRATHVHLDVAHRGLGTAACGPDTHPRHLVHGGTFRFTWRLSVAG